MEPNGRGGQVCTSTSEHTPKPTTKTTSTPKYRLSTKMTHAASNPSLTN